MDELDESKNHPEETSNLAVILKQPDRYNLMECDSVEYTVFCWGKAKEGQLGIKGLENDQVSTPRELSVLQGRQVKDVACGSEHTLFLMQDGTVFSCGNNDSGQLGHSKSRKYPGQVAALDAQVIRKVCCGRAHSCALTKTSQVFTWGDNLHGQLGGGPIESNCTMTPKLVKELSSHVVVQLVCGSNHCMALTDDSQIYVWGQNTYGQLGLGVISDHQDTPQPIACLKGLAFHQIAAGSFHSMALTISGALFAWGKNTFGQLGLGDNKDRQFPKLVKTLRNQKVKHVACGEDHSAVLTQEGGVFTFGAGMYGQLGHNSTQSELLPKKVVELMGSVVTQTACGRMHTLAYVLSSGRVYSFGLGGNGQLGVASAGNRFSPTTVKAPFVAHGGKTRSVPFHLDEDRLYVVNQIYSGGDQCFVTVSNPDLGLIPVDFREAQPHSQILRLSNETLEEVVSAQEQPSRDLLQKVEKIFSSEACLNASFLSTDDRHCGCNSKNHGVDLDVAREFFGKLRDSPNAQITQLIRSSLEKHVLPKLAMSPPDIESLRLYLSLPWFNLFNDPQSFSTVICPFVHSALCLERNPSRIIDRWWSMLQPRHFIRQVNICKQVVVYILNLPKPSTDHDMDTINKGLFVCLGMLNKLNDVNEANGHIIPYDNFYIPELQDKVDLARDYIQWIRPSATRVNVWCFCCYPFLFDARAKASLLKIDAHIKMEAAVDEVIRRNATSLFLPIIDPVNPFLLLYINRQSIVQSTLDQLTKYRSMDFKKPLKVLFEGEEAWDAGGVQKVIFLGEEALDEGGLRKIYTYNHLKIQREIYWCGTSRSSDVLASWMEFFLLLLKEILDPKFGMFRYYEESHLIWFNGMTFEDSRMFKLIGVLCGLAIYNGVIVDLSFPLALYKKLLNKAVTVEDMKQLQPPVGRSLEHLLDYEGDDLEDAFCLTFELTQDVFGELKRTELMPNGAQTFVNQDNRQQYVDAYIEYIFDSSVKEQFQAFFVGFHDVCGGRVLELFRPQELETMVVGIDHYDWDEFEKNTDYKGEFFRNHKTIQLFWEVFKNLPIQDKKKFLLFLTGSDRIPISGMKAVKFIIQPTGGGNDFLPVAHTCFNVLDLPKYDSKEILRAKLLEAIQYTQGFGLV